MHHKELAPKKKPVNEQTLSERYPNAIFTYLYTTQAGREETVPLFVDGKLLANVTLSEFIKKMSKGVTQAQIDEFMKKISEGVIQIDSWAKRILFNFLCNESEIRRDFVIEAAKDNCYDLVNLIARCYKDYRFIDLDFVKKLINSIITDSGSPISDQNHGNGNTFEITLCAKDTPTELLGIISGIINRVTSFRQYDNQCTGLILNEYFDSQITRNLYHAKLKNTTENSLFGKPNYHLEDAIINIKFLCDVIENCFPNQGELIKRLAETISEYKNLFSLQFLFELPAFLNLAPPSPSPHL
jgi:hypothetical protein